MCHGECLIVVRSRGSKKMAHAHGAVSFCARPSSVRIRSSGSLRGRLLRGVFFLLSSYATVLETLSSELFDVVSGEGCYSETLFEGPCYGIRSAMTIVLSFFFHLLWCGR